MRFSKTLPLILGVGLFGCSEAPYEPDPVYNHLGATTTKILDMPVDHACKGIVQGRLVAQLEVQGNWILHTVYSGDSDGLYKFSTVPNAAQKHVECKELGVLVRAIFSSPDGRLYPALQMGSVDDNCKLTIEMPKPPGFAGLRFEVRPREGGMFVGGDGGYNDIVCPTAP